MSFGYNVIMITTVRMSCRKSDAFRTTRRGRYQATDSTKETFTRGHGRRKYGVDTLYIICSRNVKLETKGLGL